MTTRLGFLGRATDMSAKEASGWLRDHSSRIIAFGVLLAILYLGRSVLIPLTVAVMLSFLVAPFIRALRRLRIGRIPAVFIALGAMTVSCVGVAAALGAQVLHMVESLPQYESTVQLKLKTLEDITTGPIQGLMDETNRLNGIRPFIGAPPIATRDIELSVPVAPGIPGLSYSEPEFRPLPHLWKLLTTVWHPIQFAGIVLLVLVFLLLEHDSLCDRIILFARATDTPAATVALDEAGNRLSRYFVSQTVVNIAFGLAIWISLILFHVPQALLCGIAAGLMRFIPYFGVAIAAFFAVLLALAVDAGWSLALCTLGVFLLLDIIMGQLLEPHLYGRATGLSPLSIVVGAIFWSALWGPAGLILSTPLTVCLLVAGRHMKGLGVLELMFGKGTPMTLSQKSRQSTFRRAPQDNSEVPTKFNGGTCKCAATASRGRQS